MHQVMINELDMSLSCHWKFKEKKKDINDYDTKVE